MPASNGKLSRAELVDLRAFIKAQANAREQITETAKRSAADAFRKVKDFRDPTQVDKAVTEATRAVQAQQRRMAQVTDAYLAQTTSLITGKRVRPVGAVPVDRLRRKLSQEIVEVLAHAETSPEGAGPELSRSQKQAIEDAKASNSSVPPTEVYNRLGSAYRFRTASGQMDPEKAMAYVLQRAEIMADTDIMITDRAQAAKFLGTRKPNNTVGYRRVLNPELAGGGPPCGLCVVAADRVYQHDQLMPLHARCRCTVAVVGSKDDPGFRLNSEDLAAIYKQAGLVGNPDDPKAYNTSREKLKQIRVEVVEHGELGPWLVNPQQRFRGPREVAKTQTNDTVEKALARIETLNEDLEQILARHASGEDMEASIRWHRREIVRNDKLIPR